MTLDTTVAFVQMTNRFMPVGRRGRPPRGKPPLLLEAEYARKLIAWIGELRAELVPISRVLGSRHGVQGDPATGFAGRPFETAAPTFRFDESRHGVRVRALTEPVRRKVGRDIDRLRPEMERTGRTVAESSKRTLERQTKVALGVEVPLRDERVPDQISAFVSKNMTRIRTLGDKLVGEVEAIVIDAWDKGLSQAEVAALIEARIGVAESHARFLARDQMGSLYTQVTRARHDELGIRLFRWWTENDGKVRDSHAVKHGRIFPYRGSRAPGFLPGQEYGCRCWEEPVFDEIKAQAFGGRGRARAV